MEQRYVVELDGSKKTITLREYAALEKEIFSLLCEETYDVGEIESAMMEGEDALVSALRSPNFYPVRSNVLQIAKCVVGLLQSDETGPMEIFINEKDQLNEPGVEEEVDDAFDSDDDDESDELDDILGDLQDKKSPKTYRVADDPAADDDDAD